MIALRNWSCCYWDGNPFIAPEARPLALQGEAYGHPRFPDGNKVKTGPIAAINGRVITTESGSVYSLGDPHPDYLKWLTDNGRKYDVEHPIKWKSR